MQWPDCGESNTAAWQWRGVLNRTRYNRLLYYVNATLEYIGGITLLIWRILRLGFAGRVNGELLMNQAVYLGVNSIPITTVIMCFAGGVYSLVLSQELGKRGMESLLGALILLILLREFIPMFTAIVLTGKAGAAVTSEIGSMRISEQIDALRALSADPDWFLTLPRVLAGFLMTPVVAVFAGYGGWFSAYLVAHLDSGVNYSQFCDNIHLLVDWKDFMICLWKCLLYGALVQLTACYFGFRASGGAAGVGRSVTTSVVINLLGLFILDLAVTYFTI